MPDFATKKLPNANVQARVAGLNVKFHTINPSTLPSYPAATDTIQFMELPKGARIVNSSLRVSGDIGAAGSTLQLQAVQNVTTINLTTTRAADSAGSVLQNIAPPAVNNDYVTKIQTAVATAALDASGDIEVMVVYELP